MSNSLFRIQKNPNNEILYSIPSVFPLNSKILIILIPSSLILISLTSIIFINCSLDLQNIIKKKVTRTKEFIYTINLENDPYLIIDICSLFLCSDDNENNSEDPVVLADSQQGMLLLRKYIYDISELPESIINQKLRELNQASNSPKLSLNIPNIDDIKSLKKFDGQDLADSESTNEVSFKQPHIYHKTWEGAGKELYKVTEYNESLECSVSDEGTDLAGKLNDFSVKMTETNQLRTFSSL